MLSHLCTPGINLNWSWYIILFRYFLIQFASCGSLTCLLFIYFLIFLVDVLYQVKEVPLYSWLSESFFFFFNHGWVLDFVKYSLASIFMVIPFFLRSLLILWIFSVACCIFIFIPFCRSEVLVDLTGFSVQDVSWAGLLPRSPVD